MWLFLNIVCNINFECLTINISSKIQVLSVGLRWGSVRLERANIQLFPGCSLYQRRCAHTHTHTQKSSGGVGDIKFWPVVGGLTLNEWECSSQARRVLQAPTWLHTLHTESIPLWLLLVYKGSVGCWTIALDCIRICRCSLYYVHLFWWQIEINITRSSWQWNAVHNF